MFAPFALPLFPGPVLGQQCNRSRQQTERQRRANRGEQVQANRLPRDRQAAKGQEQQKPDGFADGRCQYPGGDAGNVGQAGERSPPVQAETVNNQCGGRYQPRQTGLHKTRPVLSFHRIELARVETMRRRLARLVYG